jgi:hypothetical protein
VLANSGGWAIALPFIYVAAQLGAEYADWASRLTLWASGGLLAGAAIGLATAGVLHAMRVSQQLS